MVIINTKNQAGRDFKNYLKILVTRFCMTFLQSGFATSSFCNNFHNLLLAALKAQLPFLVAVPINKIISLPFSRNLTTKVIDIK